MSGLFGSKPTAPKVIAMPDTNSAQVKQAQANQLRQMTARSGRVSTNLTSGGGGVYSNSLLGQ